MILSFANKVIIKYIKKKYGHRTGKIVADHPEFRLKYFLKKFKETGIIALKEGSGRPKSSRTDANE